MVNVVLIPNLHKPAVAAAMQTFRPWLESRARILAQADSDQTDRLKVDGTDLVIVLGGDGTLLAQARRIVDLGAPVVGVNFGKLGFLAEYHLDELMNQWEAIVARTNPLSERVMIDVKVYDRADAPAPAFSSLAMNDCVITAGPPFRMIELDLAINPQKHTNATTFGGDGVIIATPSGSTAYNASAGGPIIAPDVDGLVITPICPQSLSFRAIVVRGDDNVQVTLRSANHGTTLVIDGQRSHPLTAGHMLCATKYPKRIRLVRNPSMAYWKRLATKMHWAAGPRNQK